MPPIRAGKQRPGPKLKTISERVLSKREARPIIRLERTYSQRQKIRVLVFLEHYQNPLRKPEQFRKPTQQEAADLY